jgi:hypothetical protein
MTTTTTSGTSRALVIHLGNHGVLFDTNAMFASILATPRPPQQQHVIFPTLTMAVNDVLQNLPKQIESTTGSTTTMMMISNESNRGVSTYDLYDVIHIILNDHELPTVWTNTMDLASLRLSSTLLVHIIQQLPQLLSQQSLKNHQNVDLLQVIHTSFLLAGLQCTSEQKRECRFSNNNNNENDTTGTAIEAIVRTMTAQSIMVNSSSASAEVSSSSSTTSSSSSLFKAIPIPTQPKTSSTSAVTILLNDDHNNDNQNDDANDLIDEDDLLQDEELYNVAPPKVSSFQTSTTSNKDDCGGRTACDDCTCGRKEQEAQEGGVSTSTVPQRATPVTSACGKCGLGDAFRCASCPYLGKPAFKPGQEHLVLDLQDDL